MSAKLIDPLPRNMTGATRVLFRLPNNQGISNYSVGEDLAGVQMETAQPIRRFYSWKGKRNYEGRWWSSTTGSHIAFESLLERDALMAADFNADVVAVAAQPVALLWPRASFGPTYHVPDFFLRLSNGDGRIVDVKRPAGVEAAAMQFGLTRGVCREIGWQYDIFTGLPPVVGENVRWLAGYRQDRCAPEGGSAVAMLAAFARPTPLCVGVERIERGLAVPAPTVLANVYHLLWRRLLHVDLSEPLSMHAEVSA